jgi:long-chain acyl-CoA synthetase
MGLTFALTYDKYVSPKTEETMDGMNTRAAQPFSHEPAPAYHMLDDAVRRFAARPAMAFFGKSWSYAELGEMTDAAAAGLQALGVTKGVTVGLCLPNCPYFVVMYYAILKAGGTVVNFNPLYTEREIETQAKDAGVTIMVTLDLTVMFDKIAALAGKGVLSRVIVCSMAAALPAVKSALFRVAKRKELAAVPAGAAFVSFKSLIVGAAKPAPVMIDPLVDIATLQFTGGTTGTPKAAMLTHANIGANVKQILAASPAFAEGQERIVGLLPFFHVFAMTSVMNLGISIGAELLLLPRPDMKMLMKLIMARRPTILPGVPTLFTGITTAAEHAGIKDLSFIKYCVSGGAPIAAETAARFEAVSRCEVLEGYGLSETSPVVTSTPPGGVRRGSVGVALPGTMIEIRDPADPTRILPQGEKGEICISGPQVMRGYYNRPAETEAVMVGSALRTGDIGYLDADGYLFIVDRIKDLILCGGYNVYPRVIEEAAYQHPSVQDAIAIGVPDRYRGESPKLFVTLREGCAATPEEILAFLGAHLNRIEIPKAVEIRDALPRTMVGKLSKKELVAEEQAKKIG